MLMIKIIPFNINSTFSNTRDTSTFLKMIFPNNQVCTVSTMLRFSTNRFMLIIKITPFNINKVFEPRTQEIHQHYPKLFLHNN
uniref:Putative ovule protein n=1 Tax=Solanum chacoense TaxID=4108 RepID=A0A0V0HFA3_SOLCH